MALYNNQNYLKHIDNNEFNQLHSPGQTPPYSGIYRCVGCGREVVAEENRVFPPQNHHQHTTSQGQILWHLIVYADHKEKTLSPDRIF